MSKSKDEEYELCKELCGENECYLPEISVFHREIANTSEWLRRYYFAKGYEKHKEESKWLRLKLKKN